MKNFQVGKLTLDPRDLAILKCLQSDLPLTVLVDPEGWIAISHAGVVDPFGSSKPTSTRSLPNRRACSLFVVQLPNRNRFFSHAHK
jgi:hypothetical protein